MREKGKPVVMMVRMLFGRRGQKLGLGREKQQAGREIAGVS